MKMDDASSLTCGVDVHDCDRPDRPCRSAHRRVVRCGHCGAAIVLLLVALLVLIATAAVGAAVEKLLLGRRLCRPAELHRLLHDTLALPLGLQQPCVAALTTLIVVPIAFAYAYALTRSTMPAKGLFYSTALLPLFAPSLLSAISLIYFFGNQGFLKSWMFGGSIYGPSVSSWRRCSIASRMR